MELELTAQQEDFLEEEGMEKYYERKTCQFCGEGKGEVSITDGETLTEVFICECCDKEIFN